MLGDSSDGLVSGGMCRVEVGAVCPSSSDDDSVCGRRKLFFKEQWLGTYFEIPKC